MNKEVEIQTAKFFHEHGHCGLDATKNLYSTMPQAIKAIQVANSREKQVKQLKYAAKMARCVC